MEVDGGAADEGGGEAPGYSDEEEAECPTKDGGRRRGDRSVGVHG